VVGETQEQPFHLSFNSALKVDFKGSQVTSDGGLVPGAGVGPTFLLLGLPTGRVSNTVIFRCRLSLVEVLAEGCEGGLAMLMANRSEPRLPNL
jgi:hypothetical protein